MRTNSLIKNSLIYSLGNLIPKAVTFLLLPVYTFYLTPSQYGIVNSMQVFSSALMVLLTFGLERSLYRLFYEFKSEEERKVFLGTVTISLYSISTLIIIVLFLSKNAIGNIYKSISFHPYFFYAILSSYFSISLLIPKIYLQIKEKATNFIIISLSNFVLQTLSILFFVVIKKQEAAGMLKGMVLSHGLMFPFLIYFNLKIIKLKFNYSILKKVLAYSLPLIPSLISAWVINLSDRVFLERYFSTDVVGIYTLGYKISSLVQLIATALLMAYNPYFFKLANSEDQTNAKKNLYLAHNYYIIFLLFIGFTIVFLSKDLIILIINEKYEAAIKYIPIISASYFFMQLASLQNLAYYQKKKTFALMWVTLASSVFNIFLNFILIPKYGASGAAYATLLTQLFFFIIQYIKSQQYYFIPYNWKLIAPLTLIFILICYLSYNFLPNSFLVATLKISASASILLYLYFKRNKFFK